MKNIFKKFKKSPSLYRKKYNNYIRKKAKEKFIAKTQFTVLEKMTAEEIEHSVADYEKEIKSSKHIHALYMAKATIIVIFTSSL